MPKRKIGSVDASLGRNLIYYRKLTGLTQQQLAEALNINRTTYTKYETGDSEPSVEMLRHISALLHVDIGVLMSEEPSDSVGREQDAAIEDEDFIALRRRYMALDPKDREALLQFFSMRKGRIKCEKGRKSKGKGAKKSENKKKRHSKQA